MKVLSVTVIVCGYGMGINFGLMRFLHDRSSARDVPSFPGGGSSIQKTCFVRMRHVNKLHNKETRRSEMNYELQGTLPYSYSHR